MTDRGPSDLTPTVKSGPGSTDERYRSWFPMVRLPPHPEPHPAAQRDATSVSVVIAAFNRPKSLQDLLDDLAKQDVCDGLSPLEVVVVDDGSVPSVGFEVPQGLHCTLLRQENAGPGTARDLGIRASQGEVTVIVDDDMTIPREFIRSHLDAHRKGATVVLGLIRQPEAGGRRPLFDRFHHHSLDRFVEAHRSGRAEVSGGRLCTGNVSFRRAAYIAAGGFDLSMRRCEDRDLGIRFEAQGERLVFDEAAWSAHHSDHADVDAWLRRSREWGAADVRIAAKHPSLRSASPWAFFDDIPVIAHPAGVIAALAPGPARALAKGIYRVAGLIDRVGPERPAMLVATLAYAVAYYGGVGASLGGRGEVWRSYRAWKRRS